MGKNRYYVNLSDILSVPLSHGSALKKVFLTDKDTATTLTQFAFSRFNPGDETAQHKHITMEEFFFILGGRGTCMLGDEVIYLQQGDFLYVPATIKHQVRADRSDILEFIYFGIALEDEIHVGK